MGQNCGSAGPGPLLGNGKDGGRVGWRGLCYIFALCLQRYLSLSVHSVSFPNSISPLLNHPITPGHLCGPKLMGSCPRDGLVATFCLSLSTSNKLRPNHRVGMLMRGALGLPIDLPICGRGQPGTRGENEALTPGPCQSEGVTGG